MLGDGGKLFLLAGGTISIFGYVAGDMLGTPRALLALARDGVLPRSLAKVHPRYRTPWVAVLALGAVALVLALSGSFVQLALLSALARLATYAGTAAAVPVLRRKLPRTDHTVVLPGGAAIPVGALLLCLVFLASTTPQNLIAGGAGLVSGGVIFLFRRRAA